MAADGRRLISAVLLVLGWPAAALAQDSPEPPPNYEGSWARSGQSISVDVSSWGPDCGPRPQSSSGGGGGRVSIRQADRELVLSGGVRTERSDGCWSMNPRVRRVSHSQSQGSWRTTCRTAADDPKFEEGTYSLRATSPNAIVYREASRYDWRLQADHCVARITLSWTYSRVGAAPPPIAQEPDEPPTTPENDTPPPVRCASPGEPARILLDPGRRVEAGEQVCVRPRVVDASGCDTPAVAQLESPDTTLSGNCFEVPAEAPDGQRYRVQASAGSLRAETTLVVRSPDIMGYLAARTEDNGAAAAEATTPPSAPSAGGLSAEPARPREDPILWLVLVIAAVALLILGVAFVLFRNQRRQPTSAQRRSSRGSGPRPAATGDPERERGRLICPTCHAEFEEGQFCPHDASRLAEGVDEVRPGAVCPRCHRGFDPSIRYCPHDSEELVPFSPQESMSGRPHRHRGEKGKICPACAARYELDATFCGKDGSELVLVN